MKKSMISRKRGYIHFDRYQFEDWTISWLSNTVILPSNSHPVIKYQSHQNEPIDLIKSNETMWKIRFDSTEVK